LFILAHVPVPVFIQKAEVSDKSLHFLAYLILAFLTWFVLSGGQKVKWRRATPWLLLLLIVIYAILDEWLQSYVKGRSCDIQDFFADLAGALTGLILFSFLSFWPAGFLLTTTFIFIINNVTQTNLAELLPVTNVLFHLLAYGILTILWIKSTHLFPAAKFPNTNWLLLALAGPTGFLIIVKLFTVIIGKDFIFSEVIISFGAIVAVVTDFYQRKFQKSES
jgi:uncharacterized protein YfiM (DUF2279 family)